MIRDNVKFIADAIIAEKDHLTALDTKIGDGDHGLNMARGVTAALEALDELDDEDVNVSKVLKTIGQAFVMNVGGASGPLYGTGFIEASKVLTKDSTFDIETIAKVLGAAIAGIQRRGHSNKGDKTMLDTLMPIHESLQNSLTENKSIDEALEAALLAAREGVEFTKTIAAKRGRASYIGDRSIGTEDPGAVSSMILFKAFCQSLKPAIN